MNMTIPNLNRPRHQSALFILGAAGFPLIIPVSLAIDSLSNGYYAVAALSIGVLLIYVLLLNRLVCYLAEKNAQAGGNQTRYSP